MSLAVTNAPNNGPGFGDHRVFGSATFMSCHDPYPTLQPWAVASAAAGHFGAPPSMPQSHPVDTSALYSRLGPANIDTAGPASYAGVLPFSDPSYPPAGPATALPANNLGDADRAALTIALHPEPMNGHVLDKSHPPTPLAVSSSVNPNDLATDRSHEARRVIVQIEGDVGRFLASRKDKVAVKPAPSPVFKGISIVQGDVPSKGFSIDYYGLDQYYENGWENREQEAEAGSGWETRHPQRIGWGDDGTEDPTFLCQICGLKWRGVRSALLRGRSATVRHDTDPDSLGGVTLKRTNIDEFYFHLADEVSIDPCIKGITMYGNPPPDYRPPQEKAPGRGGGHLEGADEQECCPPMCNRRLPPQVLECIFDNCAFLNRSHAELRKHLLKKHTAYIRGLISRCQEEKSMDECDRIVCHFLMRSFAGLDAAGKRKISDPKRTVLSPDQMSNPACYAEHAEWITYVAPPQTTPIIEFHTDEDGQPWQLTYTMDPNAKGPRMDKLDPVTRLPLPGGRKRRRVR